VVSVGLLIAACSNTELPSPTATAASPAASASLRPALATASPSPVGGGCGSTQAFAGPGPDAALGLADNPWAPATPADAGIVAYFWYPPPDLLFAHGPNDRTKVLWIFHRGQAAHLIIAAHPLNAASPVVRFAFGASGGGSPSSIDLPSPGCWRLELTLGTTHATIDVMVAPARS
jgi:hypothetical protein